MKRKLVVLAVTGVVITVAGALCGCGGSSGDSSGNEKPDINKLQQAYEIVYAQYGASSCYEIAADGSYISLDTNPYNIDDYYDPEYMAILQAMNTALGLPDYVYASMLSTSYLQGKQTEIVAGVKVTWSYHPNYGLEALYIIV